MLSQTNVAVGGYVIITGFWLWAAVMRSWWGTGKQAKAVQSQPGLRRAARWSLHGSGGERQPCDQFRVLLSRRRPCDHNYGCGRRITIIIGFRQLPCNHCKVARVAAGSGYVIILEFQWQAVAMWCLWDSGGGQWPFDQSSLSWSMPKSSTVCCGASVTTSSAWHRQRQRVRRWQHSKPADSCMHRGNPAHIDNWCSCLFTTSEHQLV